MQQAIPAQDYNADQRAQRARGGALALIALAVAALAIPAGLVLLILL
jgi:hypothetical protein